MPNRWTAGAVALAALLSMVGCGRPGPGDPAAPVSGAAVLPAAAFVAQVKAARHADYAGRAGVVVRDEAAFEEMRRWLIDRYAAAEVTRTIAAHGAVFDCMRRPGDAATPPAPAAPPAPAPATASGSAAAPAPSGPAATGCPPGSVPVRRVSLDELVRFPTLAAFLGKGPGPEAEPS